MRLFPRLFLGHLLVTLVALGALLLRPGAWIVLLLVAVPAIGGWSLLRRR